MGVDLRRVLGDLGIRVERVDGEHYIALCPYHQDDEPSWYIRRRGEKKGLHHCFACVEGGDLLALVMHCKGYGTRDGAREWLDKHGEALTPRDLDAPAVELHVARRRAAFRMARGYVFEPLAEWPGPVRDYAEERGLDGRQVERWSVGYALEGRLQGRIVFPVHDDRGSLASYMGRAFTEQGKRYLYPRSEEGPDQEAMFGERHWPDRDSRKRHVVVVTEGALKSLAVERATGHYHGALGGSGVSAMRVAKLARWGTVVVLTDEDPAGRQAREELAGGLGGHTRVVHVRLDEGKDPDTVSPHRLRKRIEACLVRTAE